MNTGTLPVYYRQLLFPHLLLSNMHILSYFKKCIIYLLILFGSTGSPLPHVGFSLQWLLLLWSTGSVVVAHGLSCPAECGTFLGQGKNLSPLCWQMDSQPLDHQGSPQKDMFKS